MRKPPTTILALAAMLASPLLATPMLASAMVVPLDHTTRLHVPGSASSVVVGNPAVADVTVVDSHTIYVSGRGYGSTDVTVVDRMGRTLYAGDITVAPAGANVSVYRGVVRSSIVCNPACAESASPAAQAKVSSGGGLGGPVGGALGAVGDSMAHAVTPTPGTP